jgi:hypothetical protein
MFRECAIFHKLTIKTDETTISVDVDFTAGPLRYKAYMCSNNSTADFSILKNHENMTEDEKQIAFVSMFNKMRINLS